MAVGSAVHISSEQIASVRGGVTTYWPDPMWRIPASERVRGT